MPQLVLPDERYKQSYLQALDEYQAEGLAQYVELDRAALERDFAGFVRQLRSETVQENVREGYVPHTTLWLVEGDTFLGRVDIRHELTDYLRAKGGHIGYDIRPTQRKKGYGTMALEMGIEYARKLGLEKVLLTCDVGNIGSNKIIQASGGVLDETASHDKQPEETAAAASASAPEKNRYWIELQTLIFSLYATISA